MSQPRGPEELLVVAGEASGDAHAAGVLSELLARRPGVRPFGMGGERCAAAGLERLADSAEISVVGITEVWRVLPRARQIFRRLLDEVERRGARTALLVDFAEFNLRLAKALKRRGVRVVYYVSPQIWAWRRGRVKTIARVVDRMLVLFPFEEAFYREHGVEVTHVGHPLVDQVPELERPPRGPRRRICLLPGSRASEIRHHLPVMARAAQLMAEEAGVEVSWIVAAGLDLAAFSSLLPPGLDLEIVRDGRFEAIAASDLALCASGTATLEVGLLGTPMVVVYKVSRLTSWIGRVLVRLRDISLVNLVLGRAVVPEVLQGAATAARIRDVAMSLLDDPRRLHNMTRDLAGLRSSLGSPGAGLRAARVVESVLDEGGSVT